MTIKGVCVIVGCKLMALVTHHCPSGMLPDKYTKSILGRVPGQSAGIVYVGLGIDLQEQYGVTSYEIIQNNNIQATPELLDHISHTGDHTDMPDGLQQH